VRDKQDRSPHKIPREKLTGDHKEGNLLRELKTTEGGSSKRTLLASPLPLQPTCIEADAILRCYCLGFRQEEGP